MEWIKKNAPGMLLCLVIAIPSCFLGDAVSVVGGAVFAMLIGMAVTVFFRKKGVFQSGIAFTSKKILQYAVVLLGFGLNLGTVAKTGAQSLPVIISTIATSLIVSYLLFCALKIPGKTATLIGVGSSICGGSAIAAAASAIDADDEQIAQSISVVFLFNVIAALVFPTLGGAIGLTNDGFALFAGTAINDTSSVTAAASAWDGIHGSNTLMDATVVKLTRTLAIIPITIVLALRSAKKAGKKGQKVSIRKIFPFFILFFVLASLITTIASSLGVSASVFSPLKTLSRFFIVWAMAAIGLNTDVVKLIKTGARPILLGLCCWVAIGCVSLLMQHVIGIW